MSQERGRPKIDNPKNVRLEIRLTQDEADRLAECANLLNISRTDVINKGISMVKAELDKK